MSERTAAGTAVLVVVVVTILLAGPGLFAADALPAGAFHPGHAFFGHHLATLPAGGRLLHPVMGWPVLPEARPIALVPLLAAAVTQGLGPLRAYGFAVLVGPVLTVLAAGAWMSQSSKMARAGSSWGERAAPWVAAVGFALCPFALAALGNGQLAKQQLWVLPAVLWALDWHARRPGVGRLMGVAGVTLAGLVSAPSLAVQLPVAVGLWWAVSRKFDARGLVGPVVVALSLVPGAWYLAGGANGATRPSVAGTGRHQAGVDSVAALDDLLLGWGTRGELLDSVNHTPVLGLPVLLAALWVGRGARLAWWLAVAGGVLALGPVLTTTAGPVTVGG